MYFFFNDTATTEIYTLSLHDALPIFLRNLDARRFDVLLAIARAPMEIRGYGPVKDAAVVKVKSEVEGLLERLRTRSEEHTSELQSRQYLVCRLLLEKKKNVDIQWHCD